MGLSRQGQIPAPGFRLDVLTGMASFSAEGSLLAGLGKHEIFTPSASFPPMSVSDLAGFASGETGKPHERTGQLYAAGRNPDVLTCIANLSNDEVFTPPEFANRMLDTLAEAWAERHGGEHLV
jgi:hypothetical protein